MSSTTFLTNEALWLAISACIKNARRVDAAIAYFGQGGAKLLPLRNKHRLVVDMSLATVKAGSTDPREIEKLIRRGVKVFTRRNLHAKVVVADKSVIAGSANVSGYSQKVLDEAALLTTDGGAVRRAREFIDRLCTEPVRQEYLDECKKLYRPPRGVAPKQGTQQTTGRTTHAKLWMVNLSETPIPDSELIRYEQGEAVATTKLKNESRTTTDNFHWPFEPRMASELKTGDWILRVMTYDDKSVSVLPPAQLLYVDNYIREAATEKERWVFHLEVPRRGETLTWAKFRRAAKSVLSAAALKSPRTRAVRDVAAADDLLRLWTAGGRVSRR